MIFEGFSFVSPRRSKRAAFADIGGFVFILGGGWLALQGLTPSPKIQDVALAIWVGLIAGASLYLVGPRRQQWGRGSLSGTHVLWESAETLHGELVRRWHPSCVLIQGPRYVWLVVLAVTPWLTHNKPESALFLVLALYAWITPLYREVWTIQTITGRQRIYGTTMTHPDSNVSD